jgi:MoxR-like ATPase
MNPHNPDKPVINPRVVVAEGGPMALARLLAGTGYIIQEKLLGELAQAIKGGAPHLIEGERGSGKTALAEAIAQACNLPVFYLQGMEGLTLSDVLYSWDKEGQDQWVRQAVESGVELSEARKQTLSSDYLMLGEALGAFEFAGRTGIVPILIVDEIDKLKDTIEDMLLQLFGRGFSHVPRFGEVGVWEKDLWPIVILLSNDIRHDLSAPMRSRCVYSWLDMPSAREEVAILCARVPDASREAVAWVAKLLDCVRGIPGVKDKPALREGICLLTALMRDEVKKVDEPTLMSYLCLIAKRKGDRSYLEQSIYRMTLDVNKRNTEVDVWVEQEFSSRERGQLTAVAA